MQRGADILRAKSRMFCRCAFHPVIEDEDEAMVRTFFENGAEINKQNQFGETALNIACELKKPKIVSVLIEFGADLNMISKSGLTCLDYCRCLPCVKILVKELAKMEFEGQPVRSETMKYLRDRETYHMEFYECLDFLKKMRDTKFYHDFSIYDIFNAQKNRKKFVLLFQNEELVEAYKSSVNCQSFGFYTDDLNEISEDIHRRSKILSTEEAKLRRVFTGHLPTMSIRYIAQFANEHLFF